METIIKKINWKTYTINKWHKTKTQVRYFLKVYYSTHTEKLDFANVCFYDRKTKKEAIKDANLF